MEKKELKKCPVCGKFANEKQVKKYDELVLANTNMKDEVERLRKQVDGLMSANVTLARKCQDRADENLRLKNRGFFARLFNL